MPRFFFIAAIAAVLALPLCSAFPLDKTALSYLNNATAGPSNAQYTYSQSSGRFQGKAYDGGYIDVVGCSGASGACRNNPSCQCKVDIGPLPRATCVFAAPLPPPRDCVALIHGCSYTIGPEIEFKGMPSCYNLCAPLRPPSTAL